MCCPFLAWGVCITVVLFLVCLADKAHTGTRMSPTDTWLTVVSRELWPLLVILFIIVACCRQVQEILILVWTPTNFCFWCWLELLWDGGDVLRCLVWPTTQKNSDISETSENLGIFDILSQILLETLLKTVADYFSVTCPKNFFLFKENELSLVVSVRWETEAHDFSFMILHPFLFTRAESDVL